MRHLGSERGGMGRGIAGRERVFEFAREQLVLSQRLPENDDALLDGAVNEQGSGDAGECRPSDQLVHVRPSSRALRGDGTVAVPSRRPVRLQGAGRSTDCA